MMIKRVWQDYILNNKNIPIILGFFICCWFIWLRVFRIRSPYSLNDVDFTLIKYLFISISLLIFIIIFITNIFVIFNIQPLKSFIFENSLVTKFLIYIKNSPKEFFEYLYNKYSFRFLETPMSHIVVHFYNPKGILFFTILILSPSILLSIIFFIEVIVYNYVFVFIKLLLILVIPLTLRIIVYISNNHSKKNLEYVRSFVEFFRYEGDTQIFIKLKPEYENVKPEISLTACMHLDTIYVNIRNFTDAIEEKVLALKPYFMLIYSSLFFISWMYILLYSFK